MLRGEQEYFIYIYIIIVSQNKMGPRIHRCETQTLILI